MRNPVRLTAFALAASVALAACGASKPVGFAATLPPPPADVPQANVSGAIYQPTAGYAPLHTGLRASRVGDLVTIVLLERTQTSKSASSKSSRDGSFGIAPPSVGPFSFDPGNLNSSSSQSFKGSGDAAQTSAIRGDITVTIAEVLPGGIARVRGEKLMNLSQGEEWIQVTGLVRLIDIDAGNRVASTRIADARITYSGKGQIQRASTPGWLARFFSLVSPF